MAISTFMRKEIKFMLSMEQYEALLEEIHKYMDPDQYCVGGKDYGIYNLYYSLSSSMSASWIWQGAAARFFVSSK